MGSLADVLLYTAVITASLMLIGGGMYTLGYLRGSQGNTEEVKRLQRENRRLRQTQGGNYPPVD